MWADISVQTKIFDPNSQPMLVGGFIENFSKQNISKKGIIVGKNANDMIITDDTVFDNATIFLQGKTTGRINNPYDIRFIDCTDINEEQFTCALQFLIGNTDYYVKAFVIDKDDNVFYGSTEKVHTQDFNRYDGWADYANVYYYSSYTLFDVVTDEIIDKDKGYYSTTNESPTTVMYRTGGGAVYKLATEWNYKLWYSQVYHGTLENNSSKVVHLPVMKYADGLLTIVKNPLDADKDITIYYSINGNYFRPETYTDVYTAPIEITGPCAVYCYAISSDGYISYTNTYYVEQTNDVNEFGTVADVVDLGLSVKWATWNVGADRPEGLGDLYAWGELSPKTDYSTSTYKFYSNGYTKYGSIDNKYQLDREDDVAQQTWGDKWRIPTIEELKELKEKCTFTKTELNGVPVTKVTGPNGNFIYFPYPGNFTGTTLYFENSIGSYWSSDLESNSYAKDLDFRSGMPSLNGDSRYHGQSIRPVYVETLPILDDNGDVDYGNGDVDEDSDLSGNIIGNIYYNISDENGEYSSADGCIVLRKPTSDTEMNNLEGQDIFGEDFKNGFTGIVFMVQGSGTIKVNAESIGSMTLKVKIGYNAPITMELEGKMKASFPYSVTEPTYVYIYGGETQTANARGLRAASSENALKIYGIEWSKEATAIESIRNDAESKAVIYNMNGQRVEFPSKCIYIINGKKVIIK